MGSNVNNAELAEAQGIRPVYVSLSASGETAHIHCDRAVASQVAVLLHERGGTVGLLALRDALDRTLTASAQPASVSNRPVPYFPEGGRDEPGPTR